MPATHHEPSKEYTVTLETVCEGCDLCSDHGRLDCEIMVRIRQAPVHSQAGEPAPVPTYQELVDFARQPQQLCRMCEHIERIEEVKYRCKWNLCYMRPHDICPCSPSHFKQSTQQQGGVSE